MSDYVLVVVFMLALVSLDNLVFKPLLERIALGNPFNGMLAVVMASILATFVTLIIHLSLPLFLIL